MSGFTGSAGTAVILKDEVIFQKRVTFLCYSSGCALDSPHLRYPPGIILSIIPLTCSNLCRVWQALLWTDGRYHLQADQQLGKGWTLMKAGKPSVPTIQEFLAKRLPKDARVGIDPFVHSVSSVNALEKVRSTYHCWHSWRRSGVGSSRKLLLTSPMIPLPCSPGAHSCRHCYCCYRSRGRREPCGFGLGRRQTRTSPRGCAITPDGVCR